mgnify:CR=1 FL=1
MIISQSSINSMFVVDDLWDASSSRTEANIYCRRSREQLGSQYEARPRGSYLLAHNATEIAVEQFEIKGMDLAEVLAALLMTNQLAGQGLTHRHLYSSSQTGGFVAADYVHPKTIVRGTVKAGLSTVAELIGRNLSAFEVDQVATPEILLPSLYYVMDMLTYYDHTPNSFIIDDEGVLKTISGNKKIPNTSTPIKRK